MAEQNSFKINRGLHKIAHPYQLFDPGHTFDNCDVSL